MIGNEREAIETLMKEAQHREECHHKVPEPKQERPSPSFAFPPKQREASKENNSRQVGGPTRHVVLPLRIDNRQVERHQRFVQVKPR